MIKISVLLTVSFLLLFACNAGAHHGGVSLAFGPGTPIETNSPLTLPQGGFVVSTRVEHVDWTRYTFSEPENKSSFTFMNVGLSYGFTPYLTGSLFIPYAFKRQDSLGTNDGMGDMKFQANLGFHYEPSTGFSLNHAEDTGISLETDRKTWFGLTAAVTAPTGKSRMELGGEVARDMQPGFRSPSFTVGASAAKYLGKGFTLAGELSYDIFTTSDDFKFGNEFRANLAGVYELYGRAGAFIPKIDGILELNLLNLSRDEEFGESQLASGGTILYITPGMRFSIPALWNASLGIGVKVPVWRSLNEQSEQQGAEGLERYRAIVTLSFYF